MKRSMYERICASLVISLMKVKQDFNFPCKVITNSYIIKKCRLCIYPKYRLNFSKYTVFVKLATEEKINQMSVTSGLFFHRFLKKASK